MDKEKHVTTAYHSGGNKFPRRLCYNYFSSFIVNIGLIGGLKMKVYDLSYSEYTESVADLYLKYLFHNEEESKEELYNLLTADGSDFFFHMSFTMSDRIGRVIDFLCYYLLLSVRVTPGKECLAIAFEIIQEALEEIANEKRK